MDQPNRRTFLRSGAGAIGLIATSNGASTAAAEESTSTRNEPPDPTNSLADDLDGESERTLLLSIGVFIVGWVAFLWALRVSGDDS